MSEVCVLGCVRVRELTAAATGGASIKPRTKRRNAPDVENETPPLQPRQHFPSLPAPRGHVPALHYPSAYRSERSGSAPSTSNKPQRGSGG